MRINGANYFFLTVIILLGISIKVSPQEKYPDRPITIVAPFPPGGVADLTARPGAAALEKVLKNPVVVVNKTGAGGRPPSDLVSACCNWAASIKPRAISRLPSIISSSVDVDSMT